jgi:hypothetical protein
VLAGDMILVATIEEALSAGTVTLDRFYFDWRGGRPRAETTAYDGPEFLAFRERIATRQSVPGALDHDYWSDPEPCAMHIDEVEAIWARIDQADDWPALHVKLAAVRRMGEAYRRGA